MSLEQLQEVQRHIDACSKYLDRLIADTEKPSPYKINTLLDAAMAQIENTCLVMRRLSDAVRPPLPDKPLGAANYHSKTIYGSVELLDTGWLHIRLNTLLPHYKILGGAQYITDSITRLLDTFARDGGKLPLWDKAHIAIIEHCDPACCEAYDHDNKGYPAVINSLKGRVVRDDNQFELSLGLFTSQNGDAPACHIYVLPDDEAGDFQYYRISEGL